VRLPVFAVKRIGGASLAFAWPVRERNRVFNGVWIEGTYPVAG